MRILHLIFLLVFGCLAACAPEVVPPEPKLLLTIPLEPERSPWARQRPCIEGEEQIRAQLRATGLDVGSVEPSADSASARSPFSYDVVVSVPLPFEQRLRDPLARGVPAHLRLETSRRRGECLLEIYDLKPGIAGASPAIVNRLFKSFAKPGPLTDHDLDLFAEAPTPGAACLPIADLEGLARPLLFHRTSAEIRARNGIGVYVLEAPSPEYAGRCSAHRSSARDPASRTSTDFVLCDSSALAEAFELGELTSALANVDVLEDSAIQQADSAVRQLQAMVAPLPKRSAETVCRSIAVDHRVATRWVSGFVLLHEAGHVEVAWRDQVPAADPTRQSAQDLLEYADLERRSDLHAFAALDALHRSSAARAWRHRGDPIPLIGEPLAITMYLAIVEARALVFQSESALGRTRAAEDWLADRCKEAGLPELATRSGTLLVAMADAMHGGEPQQAQEQREAAQAVQSALATKLGYQFTPTEEAQPEDAGSAGRKLHVVAAALGHANGRGGVFVFAYPSPIESPFSTRAELMHHMTTHGVGVARGVMIMTEDRDPSRLEELLVAIDGPAADR